MKVVSNLTVNKRKALIRIELIGKFIDFYLFIIAAVSRNFFQSERDARCFFLFLFHFPCLPFMDILIVNSNSPTI
jgi:hypothetical protein